MPKTKNQILNSIKSNIEEAILWLNEPQDHFSSMPGCGRIRPLEEACRGLHSIGIKVQDYFAIGFNYHENVVLQDLENQFYEHAKDLKSIGLYHFKHTKTQDDNPLCLQNDPAGLRFIDLMVVNPPRYKNAAKGKIKAFKSLYARGAFEEFIPLLAEWVRYLNYLNETGQGKEKETGEDATEEGTTPNGDKNKLKANLKIISALSLHHNINTDEDIISLPITVKKLAEMAGVSESTAERFMKKIFQSMKKYKDLSRRGTIASHIVKMRDEKRSFHQSYED